MCLSTVDGHALATITARDVILCGETRHAQGQVKTSKTSYNYNYNQTTIKLYIYIQCIVMSQTNSKTYFYNNNVFL